MTVNHDLKLFVENVQLGDSQGYLKHTPFRAESVNAISLEREIPRHWRFSSEGEEQKLPLYLCEAARTWTLRLVRREERMDPMTLTVSELDLFLDGSAMVGRVALTPAPLTHFSLAPDRTR